MVELHSDSDKHQLILYPNRSMSWEGNKKILLVMFIVNMIIAISWTVMGAWMVLPFAGLEILLVGIGMYYVSWKLNFKEVITFEAQSLVVQKGVYYPKKEWRWQKDNTSLLKQPSNYRMSAPTLFLRHLGEQVEVGSFLNRKEKITLREHLAELGLPVVTIAAP